MNIPIPLLATFLGSLFSILILVIGILINVLSKNTETFKKIEIVLAKQETANEYEEKIEKDKHSYISQKLAEHSSKIEAHGIIINEHEFKIKDLQTNL